jgi:uncharacterized protein YdiU (UPF0061 family)
MINFNNTYKNLPDNFHSYTEAEKVSSPTLLAFNRELAIETLGIDISDYSDEELTNIFSGQTIPEGAANIALAYAGHQFGNFVPRLGDGRALLLGEVVNKENQRFDIQLKGSGQTTFSRGGDGKSSLGPVIREYILSEAMHKLGIPTTRSLAAVVTGDFVYRETPLPGGIFTRVASSHIRIGTFEYFSAQGDIESLKTLTNYTIDRHFPHIKNDDNIYISFLKEVAKVQSSLIAKWMRVGFIHGVMNTDNMSISGETIDFGPCAFMDNFSFKKKFSSIDRYGRYAYDNQMNIAIWNLSRLANSLIPLINESPKLAIEELENLFEKFPNQYQDVYLKEMISKFGLFELKNNDDKLIHSFLEHLEKEGLDFTLSFRKLIEEPESFSELEFYSLWQERLQSQEQKVEQSIELMSNANPVFIPRNHQVERAIQAALQGDYSIFHTMNDFLKNPYESQMEYSEFMLAPKASERVLATFCGT